MELVWRENENRTEIRPIKEWNKSKEKEQKNRVVWFASFIFHSLELEHFFVVV